MITPRDILLGMLVVAIWAMHTVVIKMITIELDPVTALAIRIALCSAMFLPFIRWPGKEKFILLCQISFLMAVCHWGTLFWSLERLDASITVILMQTQIIFSIGWGILLFREKIGWRSGVGVIFGLIGVIVLVGVPANPPPMDGVIGMIISMLFVSLCYARMKALSGVTALNYLAHLHILSFLPVLLLAFTMESPLEYNWEEVNFGYLILPFCFQVIIVSASHILWQQLLTRNDMSVLPNLILLMPFLGVVFAMLILDETLTMTMVAGGLLTTAGVGIILIRRSQKAIYDSNVEVQ